MTVGELKAILAAFPDETKVVSIGMDKHGYAEDGDAITVEAITPPKKRSYYMGHSWGPCVFIHGPLGRY